MTLNQDKITWHALLAEPPCPPVLKCCLLCGTSYVTRWQICTLLGALTSMSNASLVVHAQVHHTHVHTHTEASF